MREIGICGVGLRARSGIDSREVLRREESCASGCSDWMG